MGRAINKRKVKETTKGFNPDNCLGWTEEEFALMICRMALMKMRNNIRLTPDETHIWCDYGDDFNSGKLEKIVNKIEDIEV